MPRDLLAEKAKSGPRDLLAEKPVVPPRGPSGSIGVKLPDEPADLGRRLLGQAMQQGFRGVDAGVRGAADVFTFGLADEIAAGAGAATGIGGEAGEYTSNLEAQRGRDRADQADYPIPRLAGQVGAGVALASRMPSLFAGRTSLGGQMLSGGATAGAFGLGHGFGSGEEGIVNRLLQAGKEGVIGTATGAAFPLVAAGANAAYRKIVDALANKGVAQGVGASPESLRHLGRVMDADGTLGPAGQSNMAAAGPDAMLADAGPNARAVLDTAIQRGGPGATMARDRIGARVAQSSDDLVAALDDTLGAPGGVTAARTAIRTDSAPARAAAYDAAYSKPIDYASEGGQALENIVKARVPASAVSRANELMRAEGYQSQQILARVADDGSVAFETLPDVRQLDYITRALNDVAEEANGKGKLGGTTALGRAYEGLSRTIRDTLGEAVPEYKTALATAADPIRRSKAVELGSKLLSPSMRRDEVAEAIAGMTEAERGALSQGLRSQIDDTMAGVTRTLQDGDVPAREAVKALKDLSSRATRDKLEMALGDKAQPLLDEIDRIARTFDLRASVAENSKTYARLATDRAVKDMTEPGPVFGKLAEGKPLEATKGIVQALMGTRPQDRLLKQDRVYSELADLLTRPAGGGVFDAVSKIGKTDEATKMVTDRIARALSGRRGVPAELLIESQFPSRQQR